MSDGQRHGDDLLGEVPSVTDFVLASFGAKYGLLLRRRDHDRAGDCSYYCNERACVKIVIDAIERTFFVSVLNIAGKGEWWENGPVLSVDWGLKVFAPNVTIDYSGGNPRDREYLERDLRSKLTLIEQHFPQVLNGDFSSIPEEALR